MTSDIKKTDLKSEIVALKKDIEHLSKIVEDGFRGVHARQDLSNGRLYKHEERLTKLETEKSVVNKSFLTREEYEKREGESNTKHSEREYLHMLEGKNKTIDTYLKVFIGIIIAVITFLVTNIFIKYIIN